MTAKASQFSVNSFDDLRILLKLLKAEGVCEFALGELSVSFKPFDIPEKSAAVGFVVDQYPEEDWEIDTTEIG